MCASQRDLGSLSSAETAKALDDTVKLGQNSEVDVGKEWLRVFAIFLETANLKRLGM